MQVYSLLTRVIGLFVLISFISCSGDHDEKPGKNPDPVLVTLSSPEGYPGEGIRVSGRTQSRQTAQVSTRIMGTINRIYVKPGDPVRKGQALATINSNDIQAKRAQTQAAIAEAEAHLKNAQRDYERFTNLFNKQSATAKELDNVTLQYNAARSRLDAAKQMKNEVNAIMTYSTLTAPFDGVVTLRSADEGDMANPGMPLITVEQTGELQVSATVSESDIPLIKKGDKATVEIRSQGKTISATIVEISPSSQFTGGQYQVKLSLSQEDRKGIFPGMYVDVIFPTGKRPTQTVETVLVPVSCLVKKDQLTGLYTVSSQQTALLRWIRTGKTYGDKVEVLSGLSPKETYILHSDSPLYNGAPVRTK